MTDCKSLQVYQPLAPIGNLEAYMQWTYSIPMLTPEEEQDLAFDLQDNGNVKAAERLVLAHLRYVVRVSKGYMGYGLQLGDLIQEGTVGLMKAVKRYQPEKGVRLVSFAVHWIKAEIHEFILKNWRIVKVATTKAQRKLFFNLRNSKKRLGWFTKAEVEAVAEDLGVPVAEVTRMEARLNARDTAFDMPVEHDANEGLLAPVDYLEASDPDPAVALEVGRSEANLKAKLFKALSNLDERSQEILKARWFPDDRKVTLQALATKFNVSAERIRQLEKQAMAKLKEEIVDTET